MNGKSVFILICSCISVSLFWVGLLTSASIDGKTVIFLLAAGFCTPIIAETVINISKNWE